MNRAVFDTNVIVSGFLSPDGPPGRIVEWLRCGAVIAVLDDRIFVEYSEVLVRPALGLPVGEVEIVLAAIRAKSFWVEAAGTLPKQQLPDSDDAPFLECARTAEVPLVTGNTRHFPKSVTGKISVLTPAQFTAKVSREK